MKQIEEKKSFGGRKSLFFHGRECLAKNFDVIIYLLFHIYLPP